MPKTLKERQQAVVYYVAIGEPGKKKRIVSDNGRIEVYTTLRHLLVDWNFQGGEKVFEKSWNAGDGEVYVIRK